MTEPLVPGPSRLEAEIAIAVAISPDSDQIQAGSERSTNSLILFGIKKNFLVSERSLLSCQFTKMAYITGYNNFRGISLLSTSFKTLFNIVISRLSPYMDEIIGDHQCGFQCNRSTTDQIFCIYQILEKKWEYTETVHYSHRGWGTHDIVRLIKLCLHETYSKVHTGKHLSDTFPIQNGLKQGDALSRLLFRFYFKIYH
jgi:hypothetical protein